MPSELGNYNASSAFLLRPGGLEAVKRMIDGEAQANLAINLLKVAERSEEGQKILLPMIVRLFPEDVPLSTALPKATAKPSPVRYNLLFAIDIIFVYFVGNLSIVMMFDCESVVKNSTSRRRLRARPSQKSM